MVFVIEGMQWGDEGKGKITDFIAQKMDIVVRHQGGNNAGHTLVIDNKKFALSCLPSGIISKNITNVIANGCVINLDKLIEEINTLKEQGYTNLKLLISNKAHIIMPYHIDLDGAYEALLSNNKIGTTKKGIGPCYIDKAARRGIRIGDLLNKDYLKERLTSALTIKNLELKMLNKKPYDFQPLFDKLCYFGEILKPYITDTSLYLNNAINNKKNILFEGAQGSMLCLDHGTYPYVTSSSPLANSVPLNAGIPLKSIDKVVGILKAYTTRVGEGPFVSELHDETADLIREKGHEYGTVTKRPRRVGYLDLVVAKHTHRLSNVNYISLMLIDVLTGVNPLKICIGYELDGETIDFIPSTIEEISRCKPIYKEFEPWEEDISKIRNYNDLPLNCKKYISFIEEYLNTKVAFISVGADRKDTIIKEDIFKND